MSFPIYSYAWLIPCFPLLSAFIISISLLSFRRSTNLIRSFFGIFSIFTIAIAFCYSAVIFWQQWQGGESYRFLTNCGHDPALRDLRPPSCFFERAFLRRVCDMFLR